MQAPRVLCLALTALLASGAGCLSSGAGPGPGDVGVITDPQDVTASAAGSHVHDYWDGASRLTVVDGSASIAQQGTPGNRALQLVPADGKFVPQGTARLLVDVAVTDDSGANNYGETSLWVKPANAADRRFVGTFVRSGTFDVALAYEEADLPHQVISAWEFWVQFNATSQPAQVNRATVTMLAQAVRGLPLQVFPPHPDAWAGRSEFVLLEQSGSMSTLVADGGSYTGTAPPRLRPATGTVVPYDAQYVDVLVEWDATSAGALQLHYHGADSRAFLAATPESAATGQMRFTIDVGPGMGDSPYVTTSLWEFMLRPQAPPSASPPAFAGSYHVVATVHK